MGAAHDSLDTDDCWEDSRVARVNAWVLNWETLGSEFERRAGELAERAADDKRREEYSAWARDAVHRAIDELSLIVHRQTATFPETVRSELRVEVATPTAFPAEQRVLCINFATDSVHLHAQWRSGAPPSIHVLLSRKRGGRDARLITLPGGWLRPVSTPSGFEVCSFDSSSHQVTLEEIAFRALRLLAAGI